MSARFGKRPLRWLAKGLAGESQNPHPLKPRVRHPYHSDSVVSEINPYSDEPHHDCHQPKIAPSPPSAETDKYPPKDIQQGENREDWQNEKSPDKGLPRRGVQPALLR